MKRIRRPIAGVALLACSLGFLALFMRWKQGTPWGEREWSPDRRFYVQRYANGSVSSYLPRPPGDGPLHDGYVRLFTREGRLLREAYYRDNRYVLPAWSGDTLWLETGSGTDGPWPLPAHAE